MYCNIFTGSMGWIVDIFQEALFCLLHLTQINPLLKKGVSGDSREFGVAAHFKFIMRIPKQHGHLQIDDIFLLIL